MDILREESVDIYEFEHELQHELELLDAFRYLITSHRDLSTALGNRSIGLSENLFYIYRPRRKQSVRI